MNDAVEGISPIGRSMATGGANPFERVFDAARSQENRLQSNLSNQMSGNQNRDEFSRFLDTTFQRLQSQFTDPIQQQTFNMVKTEMKAANANNEEFIRGKIQSGMQNIQLELSLKATSKTAQGLQQLLSSQ